jgi:acetyl-CoA carboxylase beta subunit
MSARDPHRSLSATALVELVTDPGSFSPWDADLVAVDPLPSMDLAATSVASGRRREVRVPGSRL